MQTGERLELSGDGEMTHADSSMISCISCPGDISQLPHEG